MKNLKIFTLFLLLVAPIGTISSSNYALPQANSMFSYRSLPKEVSITVTIYINGIAFTQMKNIPTTGLFEVYSIIGKRETVLNLKELQDGGAIYLTLSNGFYILKAGKVSQKIAVK